MSNILKYGLMAGILISVYSLILFFSGSDLRFNMTLSLCASTLIPIIFLVMAVKAERSDQEGLISFGEALKTSFLTYLIYALVATLIGQVVFQLYAPDDWSRMVELQRDVNSSMLNMVGMDQVQIDEELEKITTDGLKDQFTGIGGIMMGVLSSAFIGLIISLVISAIMKKNPTP